jgi:8-oxo-dGTP diphosphatase
MDNIRKKIINAFGNKLRVRVCGICIENDKILLVNHQSLNEGNDFWGPPGGGMDFGQSAEENLKREFLEETGLTVEVGKFLFVHEYLSPPLHAVEMIFEVTKLHGKLTTGSDPEMGKHEQIIKNVRFVPFSEIKENKKESIHQLFHNAKDITNIGELRGYYLYRNN